MGGIQKIRLISISGFLEVKNNAGGYGGMSTFFMVPGI